MKISRGIAVGLAALSLTACDQTAGDTAATVTKTVVREAEQPARQVDEEMCAQIDSQRAINARLHRDGYADDYSAEYDRLERNAGCQ